MPNSDPQDGFFSPTLTLLMAFFCIIFSYKLAKSYLMQLFDSAFILSKSIYRMLFTCIYVIFRISWSGISICYIDS